MILTSIIALCFCTFAQWSLYQQRSLLEKKVYYIANGRIGSCTFWSLPLGRFDCTLNRYFAGEGKIDIEATLNFALLSSGYIEGNGFGSRGKAGAEAQFAIEDGDSLKVLELEDIDYIYYSGRLVKPKNKPACPLILLCEVNRLTIRRMQVMIWNYNQKYHELKHFKDVDMVTAFSFTKNGAYRALQAQKSVGK